ncbi:MAG TPA: 3'-5' exonuclease [Candidatus Saccharibacteria bacterium]|nr:3'-5' exonuclease [Candidatus Saccharibacteria bacterium]HMT39656.1 3'-5' exonuclease [Candidatus Saccharibacteria bacterium]
MRFKKDILMIDFETTDGRPNMAAPIQLAAVLLDKETLVEKKHFSSYIHQDLTDANPRSTKVHGITQEMLEGAPSQDEVMQKFLDEFGTDLFISCWTTLLDTRMLENMMSSIGHDLMEYDYHILDLWPIIYIHFVRQNKGEVYRSEETFREFGLPSRGSHDALEDCRHSAEVLRKIVFDK